MIRCARPRFNWWTRCAHRLYRQLLETHQVTDWRAWSPKPSPSTRLVPVRSYYWPIGSIPTTIAYVRAKFLSGAPSEELTHIRNSVARSMEWGTVLMRASCRVFDGESFTRIEPHWRWQIAYQAVATLCVWSDEFEPVADWAFEQLRQHPEELITDLRAALGDLALQRGDRTSLELALDGLDNGLASAMRAAQLVIDGQWAAGQAAFEAALKQRKGEIGGNKLICCRRATPGSIRWHCWPSRHPNTWNWRASSASANPAGANPTPTSRGETGRTPSMFVWARRPSSAPLSGRGRMPLPTCASTRCGRFSWPPGSAARRSCQATPGCRPASGAK